MQADPNRAKKYPNLVSPTRLKALQVLQLTHSPCSCTLMLVTAQFHVQRNCNAEPSLWCLHIPVLHVCRASK